MGVVREVEKLGSNLGNPRKPVAVSACGLLPATEADRMPPQEGGGADGSAGSQGKQ